MPEISVIVPVYRAEAYLHACIDSILSQTFSDFLFQCCRIVMQRHFYLIDPYHLCSDIPSSAACIPATKPLDHAHCRL